MRISSLCITLMIAFIELIVPIGANQVSVLKQSPLVKSKQCLICSVFGLELKSSKEMYNDYFNTSSQSNHIQRTFNNIDIFIIPFQKTQSAPNNVIGGNINIGFIHESEILAYSENLIGQIQATIESSLRYKKKSKLSLILHSVDTSSANIENLKSMILKICDDAWNMSSLNLNKKLSLNDFIEVNKYIYKNHMIDYKFYIY